jgi:hypothetical protein
LSWKGAHADFWIFAGTRLLTDHGARDGGHRALNLQAAVKSTNNRQNHREGGGWNRDAQRPAMSWDIHAILRWS